MASKNIFRAFLYVVGAIVLLKLCYNLGHRIVSKKLAPSTSTSSAETEVSPALADSTAVAPTATSPDSSFK